MAAGSRHSVLQFVRRVHAAGRGVADAELLRRYVRSRDEAAFELLVWRHGGLVLRVCRGVLRDGRAAEDAFQATFFALARNADAVARLAEPAGWLYRVASRLALKVRRADARRAAREAVPARRPAPPRPDRMAEAAEAAVVLHEEINRLADRYRTPVVLHYLQGKTRRAIADELGWPEGTVAGRLARARDLLRRRLIRRGVAFPAAGLAALFAQTADAAVTAPFAAATARAAVAYVSGWTSSGTASDFAFRLADGVRHAMFAAKVRAVLLSFLAAGFVAVAARTAYRGASAAGAPPATTESVAQADGNTAEAQRRSDEATAVLATFNDRTVVNHFKMLTSALRRYHDMYGHFPGDVTDKHGRKLLSWRVALLPLMGERALYSRFHLDEPWDSAHNKALLTEMPKPFRMPAQDDRATDTFFQGFAGPGTMFDPVKPVSLSDVTDGATNTLFVVEAGSAVPWTKPVDIPFDPAKPLPKLGGAVAGVVYASTADGSVPIINANVKPNVLRAAITRNGGDAFDWKELYPPRAVVERLRGGGPQGSDAKDMPALKASNARLRESLRAAETDLYQARRELTDLEQQPPADADAKRLANENRNLLDHLVNQLIELDHVRDSIAARRRQMKK